MARQAPEARLLFALASGVPVVTNQGDLTEPLFKTSGAVVLTDSEPDAICQAVVQLLSDHSAIQKIGTAGRGLYEKHFDISVTVAKLRDAVKASSAQVDTVELAHTTNGRLVDR